MVGSVWAPCELVEKKTALRKQMRQVRSSIPGEVRAQAARQVARQLASLPAFGEARIVGLYCALQDEFDPLGVTELPEAKHKTFVFPKTQRAQRQLRFCRAFDLSVSVGVPGWSRALRQVMSPGAYGILEPQGEEVDRASIDLLVLPGLAFDARGHRLGYGGGYYDRFLASYAPQKRPVTVALGYDEQRVPEVPVGPYDLPVEFVMTPSGCTLGAPRL